MKKGIERSKVASHLPGPPRQSNENFLSKMSGCGPNALRRRAAPLIFGTDNRLHSLTNKHLCSIMVPMDSMGKLQLCRRNRWASSPAERKAGPEAAHRARPAALDRPA